MNDNLLDRFTNKYTVADSGCWEWHTNSRRGYGAFRLEGKTWRAHRVSFFLHNGFLPEIIDHICNNCKCVNPQHLRPSSNRDNVLRGSAPTAKNARKTHCDFGHPFTKENTHWRASEPNTRECIPCRRRRYALYKEAGKYNHL